MARKADSGAAGRVSITVPDSLTSKGFRIRAFGPPPEDFDPREATARQLAAHHMPRRPDAEKEAAARAAWDRAFARPTRWIVPEFRHYEDITHGPARVVTDLARPSRAKKAAMAEAQVGNATSGNWSGAISFAPAGKTYRWVAGQWTVPSPNTASDGSYYASEWVGIDGWNSSDVLQAGTETAITRTWFFTVTDVYTWWEWWPAGEVRITNLPVVPGDGMYCLICADTTSSATVYFRNESTGVGTRFAITPPSGATLQGNVAEWIVERPTINGSTASLTDYNLCYFDECLAGYSFGADDLTSATLVTMTGGGGAELSVPTRENNHVLKAVWRKSS
jgi:Peptidase A4 family